MKTRLICLLLIGSAVLLAGCVADTSQSIMQSETDTGRLMQSARIHTELAAEYLSRGQYEVALDEVGEALRARSDYAPAYNVLGLINMTLNEHGRALESFERAIRLAPRNPEIHNNYGWFICQQYAQRMDQAIGHFVTAAQDPLYATPEMAYANAGICELKRQKYAEAIHFFERALSLRPGHIPAQIGLITTDYQRGQLMEARTKMTRLLEQNAATPESLYLAIQIEQALQDRSSAESYIYMLQKRFPDSREAITVRQGMIGR